MHKKLDRNKVLKSNPHIDRDLLQKSIEVQEQLKRNGYKKKGYQILDRDSAILDEMNKPIGGMFPFILRE